MGDGREANAWHIGRNDTNFTKALDKQLGLKVEKRDLAREMIVIDHVDAVPTAD